MGTEAVAQHGDLVEEGGFLPLGLKRVFRLSALLEADEGEVLLVGTGQCAPGLLDMGLSPHQFLLLVGDPLLLDDEKALDGPPPVQVQNLPVSGPARFYGLSEALLQALEFCLERIPLLDSDG